MAVANRIKEWRAALDLTYVRLGALAGTTAPQIQKLERGERKLTLDWMVRIAAALSSAGDATVHPKDLLPGYGEASSMDQGDPARTEPPLAGKIPVLGAAQAGGRHEIVLLDNAIGRIARPLVLQDVKDGYALQVSGSAMEPRYWDEQIIYVDPSKPPRQRNGIVIVKSSNAVLVREFVCFLPGEGVRVKEYQPQTRELEIKRHDIKSLHTIVGSEEP
jgi:phage repressor protein C with HTH and peptisase S24 domain